MDYSNNGNRLACFAKQDRVRFFYRWIDQSSLGRTRQGLTATGVPILLMM
jgi:hypothetical protein